jgi:hypothetical protein
VAGVFLELGGDLLHGRGEVGGDGDLDFIGPGRVAGEQQSQGQELLGEGVHGDSLQREKRFRC